MTPQEFCAWLDGYLIGAGSSNIDADVIKAKAREITAPMNVLPKQWGPHDIIGPGSANPSPLIGVPMWQSPPYPQIGDFWCGSSVSAD